MDNFLENVKTAMKNAGKSISDKTQKMTANAKLCVEINGAKTNMENAFAELGKKYYGISGGSPDPELAELCSKIDSYKKLISEKEIELKKIKGERICCECGKTISDKSAMFCPFCGAKMEACSEGQPSEKGNGDRPNGKSDENGSAE